MRGHAAHCHAGGMNSPVGDPQHDPSEYGERIGGSYDEWYGTRDDQGPIVDFLAARAAGRPALELGIGTGRIALPLAARGVPVDGIDASPRMVAQLRGKPGSAELPVSLGDFAATYGQTFMYGQRNWHMRPRTLPVDSVGPAGRSPG